MRWIFVTIYFYYYIIFNNIYIKLQFESIYSRKVQFLDLGFDFWFRRSRDFLHLIKRNHNAKKFSDDKNENFLFKIFYFSKKSIFSNKNAKKSSILSGGLYRQLKKLYRGRRLSKMDNYFKKRDQHKQIYISINYNMYKR